MYTPGPDFLGVDDAVAADRVPGHFFERQDRALELVEHRDHLGQSRRRRVDHVVGQNHREGLVADERARDEDGVSEAERFALTNVGQVDLARNLTDLGELVLLSPRLEERLELDRDVEMVFDRVLAAARDQNDVVDAGGDSLFHAVLNDRFVDEWQHLLGLRLGGREKARTESGGGEDRLANLLTSGILRGGHPRNRINPGAIGTRLIGSIRI